MKNNWRTTILGLIVLLGVGLDYFEVLDPDVIYSAVSILTGLGFITTADGVKLKKDISERIPSKQKKHGLFMLMFTLMFASSGCTSAGKFAYEASIYKAISIAQQKIPDRDVLLYKVDTTKTFKGQSKLALYDLRQVSDSTRQLVVSLNWNRVTEILITEGHKFFDNIAEKRAKRRSDKPEASKPEK